MPEIFKYKHQMLMLIGLCVTVSGFGWITFFAITHAIGFGFEVLFIFLFLSYLIFVGVTIAGQSDIVIDEEGISRRLFGKTWRRLRWDNVKLIKRFPVVAAGFITKIIRGYVIYSNDQPLNSRMYKFSELILFNDGFENMDQLIELINYFALRHEIRIEIQDRIDSLPKPANHL